MVRRLALPGCPGGRSTSYKEFANLGGTGQSRRPQGRPGRKAAGPVPGLSQPCPALRRCSELVAQPTAGSSRRPAGDPSLHFFPYRAKLKITVYGPPGKAQGKHTARSPTATPDMV